jgi:hypothetical protein
MAEVGSWPSIRRHGLLSTNEVVQRAALTGQAATQLRRGHRAEKVAVEVPGLGTIVLRDQKPMEQKRLEMALVDGTSPADWYELINDRVFFWVQESRLLRLLGAREYRALEHDVLTVNTEALLATHAPGVWLCHMNSGNTFPIPHHRGLQTFQRIKAYATKSNGAPVKEVVELTVQGHVEDIAKYVTEVRRMRGAEVISHLSLD